MQRSLPETHDNFFEEKLVGLKSEMQSLMDDFKGALQSSRRVCCRGPRQALKPLKKSGSQSLRALMVTGT